MERVEESIVEQSPGNAVVSYKDVGSKLSVSPVSNSRGTLSVRGSGVRYVLSTRLCICFSHGLECRSGIWSWRTETLSRDI